MKAVRFHQHGGPDVLTYEDAPDHVPERGHAIVRVRACALNHLDLWERRGLPRVTFPLPHVSERMSPERLPRQKGSRPANTSCCSPV
jgi:NADPH:quinone reductase-like Zn-dependent oxidoreductase